MDFDEDKKIIREAMKARDFDTVASRIMHSVPEQFQARMLSIALKELDIDHQKELLHQEKRLLQDHIDHINSIIV